MASAGTRGRRTLPVVFWLSTGAAVVATGVAMATAPVACADDTPDGSAANTVTHERSGAARAGVDRRSVATPSGARSREARPAAPANAVRAPASHAPDRPRASSTIRSSLPARGLTIAANGTPAAAVGADVGSTAPAPITGETPAALPVTIATAQSSAGSIAAAINFATGTLFDTLANLLSRFPATPINDLLSGSLLLLRRALFIPVDLAGAPTVTSVNLPNADTYGTGGKLSFVVNFNEQVTVSNADVAIPVEMDYRLSGARYVSGSGTQSLLFSLQVPQYASAAEGITLGTVDSSTGVRTFGFGNLIVDKDSPSESVDSGIPILDTSSVRVDALGPQITGRSDLTVNGQGVSLTVTFDRPVIVTGTPTVPVNVDGVDRLLNFSAGNRSETITFSLASAGVTSASFRPYTGDVIYMPEGSAGISDQFGNQIYTLEGDIGKSLTENGNNLVVIGQHFERLIIDGPDGQPRTSLSPADLDSILQGGWGAWYKQSTEGPPAYDPATPFDPNNKKPWPFLQGYVPPTFDRTTNSVDVYRVAFRSSVPEQQRYTTAYGLIAVPTDVTGAIPVVEWQQATVFNLTYSAPSQAFSCGTAGICKGPYPLAQAENVPPRLEVAQFAGRGYAVFMPDPFGLGNSAKYANYAYMVKGSIQQNSTDMYNASMQLLAARNLTQSDLFLAGWSAGGNQAADWLEKIESTGKTVDGVAIASSPLSLGPAVRNALFNPRTWTAQNTGDAAWLNVSTGFSALSLGGYEGQPSTALDLLGQYYDAARRLYTQQYTGIEFGVAIPYVGPDWGPVTQNDALKGVGVTVTFTDVNGQKGETEWMPYSLAELIVPKYSTDQTAFDKSPYALLMNTNGSGRVPWDSPVYMQYGNQDEVLTPTMGMSVYSWQQQAYGKENISFLTTNAANHVGNYLLALVNDLKWFDYIRGAGADSGTESAT